MSDCQRVFTHLHCFSLCLAIRSRLFSLQTKTFSSRPRFFSSFSGSWKMSPQIETPLLPKQEPSSENHESTSGVVFNVSTSIIGAGIMSMPAAFKVLGVIPALLIITVVAWLSHSLCRVPYEVNYRRRVNNIRRSYERVVRETRVRRCTGCY